MNNERKLLAEVKDMEKLIHLNLSLELLIEIDDFIRDNDFGKRYRNRSDAVRDLLHVGILMAKKKKELERIKRNPQLLDEVLAQLKEGSLVEYVEKMKETDFKLIWSILQTEASSRGLIKSR